MSAAEFIRKQEDAAHTKRGIVACAKAAAIAAACIVEAQGDMDQAAALIARRLTKAGASLKRGTGSKIAEVVRAYTSAAEKLAAEARQASKTTRKR